ncbi:MAG: hypothetical protein ACYC0V_14295 [Armatimonadota bacterium]
MKTWVIPIIVFVTVIVIISIIRKSGPQDNMGKAKMAELASLPIGLEVCHNPNPVSASLDGRSGRKYTWLHSTTVKALNDDVEITEFGAFSWHNGRWIFSTIYARPFTQEEFAEWYSCPNAIIRKGEVATDPNNYSGRDVLIPGKSKWYFIGITKSGKRVKGEAVVENQAQGRE